MSWPVLLPAGVLLVGLVLLVKGADFLVQGASALARRLAVPEIVIGLTIVAFGTSSPELVVSLFSSAGGESELVLGNVIGSNIFNLLPVLGASALVRPLAVKRNTVRWEIPFSLAATLILLLLVNDRQFTGARADQVSRLDGAILVVFFVGFLVYLVAVTRSEVRDGQPEGAPALARVSFLVAGGLVGLLIGGKAVVDSAVRIAGLLGVSRKFVGLTLVAAGTSLPELATSVVAAARRKPDIAVGNVIGSNVFNLLLILGVSALVRPVKYSSGFNVDVLVLAAGTLALMAAMFSGRRHRLDRWEAGLLVAAYAGYTVFLVLRR